MDAYTLIPGTNGDPQIRMMQQRMNKYTKICTYLYKAWKNITWLKNTDDVYMGQILDYTETADHDDALECANLLRVLDRGKVQTIKGINL